MKKRNYKRLISHRTCVSERPLLYTITLECGHKQHKVDKRKAYQATTTCAECRWRGDNG